MTKAEELAADYWIEHTARIYAEDLHVSSPVMDAFTAGYEAGAEDAMVSLVVDTVEEETRVHDHAQALHYIWNHSAEAHIVKRAREALNPFGEDTRRVGKE